MSIRHLTSPMRSLTDNLLLIVKREPVIFCFVLSTELSGESFLHLDNKSFSHAFPIKWMFPCVICLTNQMLFWKSLRKFSRKPSLCVICDVMSWFLLFCSGCDSCVIQTSRRRVGFHRDGRVDRRRRWIFWEDFPSENKTNCESHQAQKEEQRRNSWELKSWECELTQWPRSD